MNKTKILKHWITKDGRKIPLQKVTDKHLDNIINHAAIRMRKGHCLIYPAITETYEGELISILMEERNRRLKKLIKWKVDNI